MGKNKKETEIKQLESNEGFTKTQVTIQGKLETCNYMCESSVAGRFPAPGSPPPYCVPGRSGAGGTHHLGKWSLLPHIVGCMSILCDFLQKELGMEEQK